jgi:hypothetical protein
VVLEILQLNGISLLSHTNAKHIYVVSGSLDDEKVEVREMAGM